MKENEEKATKGKRPTSEIKYSKNDFLKAICYQEELEIYIL